jgi:hypothetical protein
LRWLSNAAAAADLYDHWDFHLRDYAVAMFDHFSSSFDGHLSPYYA